MLLKLIQTYLPNGLPKLEMGELATRPNRLISWKQQIVTALKPVGPLALEWWQWIVEQAESTHVQFVQSPLAVRESVAPTTLLPLRYASVDAWLQPKLLEAIPAGTRSHIETRARVGCVDQSHLVLFWVLKQFVPGGVEEQLALIQSVENPKNCANPKTAQIEMLRWKERVRRMIVLGLPPIP